MTKLTLIALAVICSRPSGYRRASFALTQGENFLNASQPQYDALKADKHLTVAVVSDSSEFAGEGNGSEEIIKSAVDERFSIDHKLLFDENALLADEKEALNSKVADLTALCTIQEADIKELEEQLATALLAAQPSKVNVGEIGKVAEPIELDVSSAPEELHHFIAVIHDLNEEAPLTKKPNCDHLTITVDDEEVTPSAVERDEAWAWYQANVVASTDATQAEAKA